MRCSLLATVFEALGRDGRPKFNAHVIVVMPDADARDRLIESLRGSSVYVGCVDARPVDNWNGLTAYLLKEATPAAWFAAGKSFRRIRGSIQLGDLGGDRVVLSRDLRDLLIATGRIQPFRRTYAKRQRSPPLRAASYRRPQSHMADRPSLEPTPTPEARAHGSMGASMSNNLKAFFDDAAELEPGASAPEALSRRCRVRAVRSGDAALSARWRSDWDRTIPSDFSAPLDRTRAQVERYLLLGSRKVCGLCEAGVLESYPLGGSRRITRESVRRYREPCLPKGPRFSQRPVIAKRKVGRPRKPRPEQAAE
jgi:hypothetical protein